MPEYEGSFEYKLYEKEGVIEQKDQNAKQILDEIAVSGSIISNPSLSNQHIFFGSNDNHLYAITLDGKLLWKFRTGHVVNSQPVICDGVVYFGSFDSYFYAVSENDGSLLWRFKTGGRITSTPIVIDNKIYFGSEDGYLYCLSLGGSLLWKFLTGDAVLASPIVVNGVVYFGSCDKRFYAVQDGEKLWSFLTGGIVCTPVAVNKNGEEICSLKTRGKTSFSADTNGFLCFGSYDNNFYILSMDGRLLYKFDTGAGFSITRPGSCSDGIVYFGSYSNYVYAISLSDLKEIWRFRAGGSASTTPVLHKDMIFFGSTDEYLYALNIHGELLWKYKTNGSIVAVPLVHNDIVYVGSWDSYLYAIALDGPAVLWRFQTGQAAAQATSLFKKLSGISKMSRLVQRIWKPETKPSPYEKEVPQQNFTFGAAYRMHEPYKSGVEYESGGQYSMDRKKKDWRQAR